MVTHEMLQIAQMWVKACKDAKVASGELYWSEANLDGDYTITVFDREGGLWQVEKGGDADG